MPDNQAQLNLLQQRLQVLSQKQDEFLKEINYLRIEIIRLKTQIAGQAHKEESKVEVPATNIVAQTNPDKIIHSDTSTQGTQIKKVPAPPVAGPTKKKSNVQSDLEKFIGENLINKIGIAITVIGVAIGTKYAIDHQLISPLTRIILGYFAGIGLLGFAIRLKKNYENFSAVLLSGAMAIMYFITYAAYEYYQLIPQVLTFSLMVFFTAFTVLAAIHYNRQVIAIIGMVGAYAIPFLLSDGSGRILVLFTYMAIINIGILSIAIKKYWKPLYHIAFSLTWFIYMVWYFQEYHADKHFTLAFLFAFLFFATFYLTFLTYKIYKNEKFRSGDVGLMLINSFIFYGIGYALLDEKEGWSQYLGLFTLCNAVIHFIAGFVIYRQKLADKNLFYFVSGLVLVFITITIPVQLNGSWVTLMWTGEGALLFWIGRTRKVQFYENLSYLLMGLAFFSLVHDWTSQYYHYYPSVNATRITPIFNVYFLTSVLFIAAFGFINAINRDKRYIDNNQNKNVITRVFSFLIPAILLFTIYYSFRIEIETYWTQLFIDSELNISNKHSNFSDNQFNNDLLLFRTIWVINYSLAFASALALINLKKIQHEKLGYISLGLIVISLVVFLTDGLYSLSELRESYLDKSLSQYYRQNGFSIGIRYVSFVFVALAIFSFYKYRHQDFIKRKLPLAFEMILYISTLWIASSELINWMDIGKSGQSYKLGLSILWGIYSLLLIILGISKRKKHLRIGAIILFGVTLIKLFFYDIAHLDTISKTIVFVSLGILLLIISFLYNKYKPVIADETKT